MKASPLVLPVLLLAALAGAAVGSHGPHPPCDESTLSVGNSVRADVWADNSCAGVVVYSNNLACVFNNDVHLLITHTMVLHDNGCQTGEIVELP